LVTLACRGVEVGVRGTVAAKTKSAQYRRQRRKQEAELERLVMQQLIKDKKPVSFRPEVAVASGPIYCRLHRGWLRHG
jgi:hypothetical protein